MPTRYCGEVKIHIRRSAAGICGPTYSGSVAVGPHVRVFEQIHSPRTNVHDNSPEAFDLVADALLTIVASEATLTSIDMPVEMTRATSAIHSASDGRCGPGGRYWLSRTYKGRQFLTLPNGSRREKGRSS